MDPMLKINCFHNIMKIQKPQKSDNLDLLKEYFQIVYKYFCEEKSYPLIIKENFK